MSENHEMDAIERRDACVELISENARCQTPEEKQWLIDQVARTLLGSEYDQWLEGYSAKYGEWRSGQKPFRNMPDQKTIEGSL